MVSGTLRKGWQRVHRATALVAVAMLMATLGTWRFLVAREREQLRRTAELTAGTLETKLSSEIAVRTRPLERLAARWAVKPSSRFGWEEDARLFTSAYTGYQSVDWVDGSLHPLWSVPALPAWGNLGPLDYSRDPRIRAAFETARNSLVPTATVPFEGPDGQREFLVAAPIGTRDDFAGFIVGRFRMERLIRSALDGTVPAGYSAEVHAGGNLVWQQRRTGSPPQRGVKAARRFTMDGLEWAVAAWPSAGWLLDTYFSVPDVVLFAGLLISALVTATVRLAAASENRSRALEQLNSELETEMANRKRAAEALHSAHAALKALVDASPLAIARVNSQGAVVSWNAAAEKMFEWTEQEVLGRPMPVRCLDRPPTLWTDLCSGVPLRGLECALGGRSARVVTAEVWGAPLEESHGWAKGFVCLVADVGKRKRLEQQVHVTEKLEAVSRLAVGVAHHFNNLMTIVTGYSQLALEDIPRDAALRTEIEEVLRAAERAARLSVQLLAFGRGQAIRPEIVDVNRIILSVREVLRRAAGDSIELIAPLGAGVGNVRIDPAQVEQILVTLVVNSRDAMPAGGRISIETSTVQVSSGVKRREFGVPPGLYTVISVTDTGHGMDERTREHAFEPFFTTRGVGPPGLGLSSVYGIARQNGGGVTVESEPGQGTRVDVYLPRA